MGKRTPLYQQHIEAGARMVDFAGWDMPIQYHSVIEEHHCVRQQAGVFDVSHMSVVDIEGPDARDYLRRLLANDVDRLAADQALYSAMLNEQGGVIDDLICYRRGERYRLVVNCATREKDLAWMQEQAKGFELQIRERDDLAILAVNGPESIDKVCSLLPEEEADIIRALKNFRAVDIGERFFARTGYTGEQGLEILLPGDQAPAFWQALLQADVAPIGLGARDTLRLEAGMNLYGQDMDESTSPLVANMGWTIAWEPADRDFIGRRALSALREQQQRGELPRLTGLVLEGRGVMRAGQRLHCYDADGQTLEPGLVTSGSFSPTLKHSIALARIPANTHHCQADIRGNPIDVRMVKPGFVRFGKKQFDQ